MIRYLTQHGAERSGIVNEKKIIEKENVNVNPFEIEFVEFELKQ